MKKFAIVKFTDEGDAPGVIPLNWVLPGEQHCKFTPVKSSIKMDKLIRLEAEPEDDWIVCPIKILHKYDTFSHARAKLSQAEETSNLDTDYAEDDDIYNVDPSDAKKRKSKHHPFPGEISDSEDEQFNVKRTKKVATHKPNLEYPGLSSFQKSPTPRSLPSERTHSPLSSPSTSALGFAHTNIIRTSATLHTRERSPVHSIGSFKSSNSSLSGSDRILLGQIQATMAEMADQMATLNNKVDRVLGVLANQQGSALSDDQNSDFNLLGHLPLQTIEEFDVLEEKTQDQSFRNQFVKILASIGGRDLRSCIMNMLRRIMSDSLAEQFSYSGKMVNEIKKIAFTEKKICNAIHVAARKLYKEEATDNKIRELVCGWLQQAKTRRNRRDLRAQKKKD